MLYPHVSRLYIYKPPNEHTQDILRKDRLWAAKPKHFNDPFDCDLEIAQHITEESVIARIRSKYGEREQWTPKVSRHVESIFDEHGDFTLIERNRLNAETQRLIQKIQGFGIVCLSEVFDSILMWSHYAANHTGVCFDLLREPVNQLGDASLCSPIKYNAKYPQIDIRRMLINRDGRTINLMLRHKSYCWKYEKEWRMITDHGDMERPLPGSIARVILGIRAQDPFKANIQQLCNSKGIACVQAMKADREFRIEIPTA